MPGRAPSPCSKAGCSVLVVAGRGPCPKHVKQNRERERERRKRQGPRPYDKQIWRRRSRYKLSLDPMCQARGCNQVATEVDHIDGDATNNAMSNLQSLCKPHHSRKTARQDGGGWGGRGRGV